MRSVAFQEVSLDNPHRNVLHNRGSGGESRSARTNARHHESMPTHESLGHQILRLLPDILKQRWPADARQQWLFLPIRHGCASQASKPSQNKPQKLKPHSRDSQRSGMQAPNNEDRDSLTREGVGSNCAPGSTFLGLEPTKHDDRKRVGNPAASPRERDGSVTTRNGWISGVRRCAVKSKTEQRTLANNDLHKPQRTATATTASEPQPRPRHVYWVSPITPCQVFLHAYVPCPCSALHGPLLVAVLGGCWTGITKVSCTCVPGMIKFKGINLCYRKFSCIESKHTSKLT